MLLKLQSKQSVSAWRQRRLRNSASRLSRRLKRQLRNKLRLRLLLLKLQLPKLQLLMLLPNWNSMAKKKAKSVTCTIKCKFSIDSHQQRRF